MAGQRRLALGVLLGAAAAAIAAFPFRATWWGGGILAIAEAGVVGGLADWFAVTAIFRRPLGLPIPHTGLIPRNWERMAERVGVMVGGRVLTKDYMREEIGRVDFADMLARGAERISHADLERATRIVGAWTAEQLTPSTTAELLARALRALVTHPVAPLLAAALRVGRRQGWDRQLVDGAFAVLAESMDRPEFRVAMRDVIRDLLASYRRRLGTHRRMWMGVASLLGVLDRNRLETALHAGLREVITDRNHPLRKQGVDLLADLERRLTSDAALGARVEAAKAELLEASPVATLLDEAAGALARALRAELTEARSEMLAWLADRLDLARQALIADAKARGEFDAWAKTWLRELVERNHTRIAAFIENGVRALGSEGAVRLIEEHAGDDLQFIRVNGSVIGGLAGGLIYAFHLIVGGLF